MLDARTQIAFLEAAAHALSAVLGFSLATFFVQVNARGGRKCCRIDPVIVRFKLQTKFLIEHP